MSLGMILLIVLILLLLGAFPRWGYSRSWGYGPSGGLGLVLVIVLVLVLWAHLRGVGSGLAVAATPILTRRPGSTTG